MGNGVQNSEFRVLSEARILTKMIFKISFPKEQIYVMGSQIKRAVLSVSLNLKEGNAFRDKRRISHFQIAYGSISEVEECLLISKEMGYIKGNELLEQASKVARMINSLNSALSSQNSEVHNG